MCGVRLAQEEARRRARTNPSTRGTDAGSRALRFSCAPKRQRSVRKRAATSSSDTVKTP